MTDDGRDDIILRETVSGRSARSIGKQLRCTSGEVNSALDRVLPKIDNPARLRAIAIDIYRLDSLLEVFLKRATEQADVQAGVLVVKVLERRALLLGLDSPAKTDPIQLQIATSPTPVGTERIYAALQQFARQPNGSGSDENVPRAVE
jgi:hypothetical protein